MFRNRRRIAAVIAWLALVQWSCPLLAFYAGFENAAGETVFSKGFIEEYVAAEAAALETQSAEPLLKLLAKSNLADERAELEVTLGVTYGQRPGLVDPAKSVEHFTKALGYRLPEETLLKVLLWRAGAYEQLGKLDEARRDHLRGLLACADHALPEEWPEQKQPKVPVVITDGPGEVDPVEIERRRDYERYRRQVQFQQSVLMLRFYFIDGARRIGTLKLEVGQLQQLLEELTPDADKHASVAKLLASGLERPWP